MRVVIRVDASLDIGTGHVMRCLTLAQALKAQGAQVSFMCRAHLGHLIPMIQQQGFEVFELPLLSEPPLSQNKLAHNELSHSAWLGATQAEDVQACEPALQSLQPDWLVVDHYALDQAWSNALKPYFYKLMVIDDLGDRVHSCDLLLDQNYGSQLNKYADKVPAHALVMTGADYALLRAEFAQARASSLARRTSPKLQHILVSMGGVDAENVTGQLLTQLTNSRLNKKVRITVVMGAQAPHLKAVQKQAKQLPYVTQVCVAVDRMAALMTQADLAIGAAGATTWERCCLGLPTVQRVIAANQVASATALSKAGAVKLLAQISDLPGLVETAELWMSEVSQQSAKLCDGLGVEAVWSAMQVAMPATNSVASVHNAQGTLLNYIDLTATESQFVLLMRNHVNVKRWMRHSQAILASEHEAFMQTLKQQALKQKSRQTSPQKACANHPYYFLVKHQEQIVGTVNLTQINTAQSTAELGLYTNPFSPLKGQGQCVLQAGLDYAFSVLKLRQVCLEVMEENVRALKLYERLGFRVVSRSEGRPEAVIHMQKTNPFLSQ